MLTYKNSKRQSWKHSKRHCYSVHTEVQWCWWQGAWTDDLELHGSVSHIDKQFTPLLKSGDFTTHNSNEN